MFELWENNLSTTYNYIFFITAKILILYLYPPGGTWKNGTWKNSQLPNRIIDC